MISPLLANLYLHWMDKRFHGKGGPGTHARLIRYADDFVILAQKITGQTVDWVESIVEGWLKLKINRQKTRTVELKEEGAELNFLGYMFRYERDLYGTAKRYLNVCASTKAVARERDTLREMTGLRYQAVPIPDVISRLNQHLRGWANYFRYGYPRKVFRDINAFVRERLIRHLKDRSQRAYRPPRGRSYYAHLEHLGLISL